MIEGEVGMSVESTREVIESYERGEPRIAENAVYVDVATDEVYEGRDAIREWFRHKHGEAFATEFERTDFVVEGNGAVQSGYLVGTHIGEYMGVPATGAQVRIPLAVVYEVADGQIQRATIHFGMYTFLRQVGAI